MGGLARPQAHSLNTTTLHCTASPERRPDVSRTQPTFCLARLELPEPGNPPRARFCPSLVFSNNKKCFAADFPGKACLSCLEILGKHKDWGWMRLSHLCLLLAG